MEGIHQSIHTQFSGNFSDIILSEGDLHFQGWSVWSMEKITENGNVGYATTRRFQDLVAFTYGYLMHTTLENIIHYFQTSSRHLYHFHLGIDRNEEVIQRMMALLCERNRELVEKYPDLATYETSTSINGTPWIEFPHQKWKEGISHFHVFVPNAGVNRVDTFEVSSLGVVTHLPTGSDREEVDLLQERIRKSSGRIFLGG